MLALRPPGLQSLRKHRKGDNQGSVYVTKEEVGEGKAPEIIQR